MLQIVMITDGLFADRIRVSNEARAMAAAGCRVEVHALAAGCRDREFEVQGVKVFEHRLPKWCFRAKALSAEWPFYSFAVARVLKPVLERAQPDVIHVHNLFTWTGVRRCRTVCPDSIWVLDIAENLPEIMKEYDHVKRGPGRFLVRIPAWAELQSRAIREADHVVLVTQTAVDDYVERLGMDRSKALVCDNIPWKDEIGDEDFDDISEKFDGAFVMFYFGDTSTRRGTDLAIEAMPKVLEEVPNAELVIVGRNKREDELLASLRDESPARDHIHLEGFQPMDKLGSYLEVADVGLSPLVRNIHHDTTHANKLFQFMHGSLPLVVSDCTAQAELVKSTGTGLVHRAGDADQLADAVIQLAQQPERMQTMGRRGKKLVETHIKWDVAIRPYLRTLSETTGQSLPSEPGSIGAPEQRRPTAHSRR